MRLALRFDMRAPDIGAPPSVLYPASVDMCEWGDRLGFETVYLAEHHGAEDGYCPAPMIQASAILARTTAMRVHFSALIAVLHDPLRLAEDLAVLDLISGGRIEMTLGIGYRPHEYEMFGIQKSKRVPILEEIIHTLEQAWTGEPFEFRGRTVMVRPTPVQRPRPPIYIGGSTEASAYRAARLGRRVPARRARAVRDLPGGAAQARQAGARGPEGSGAAVPLRQRRPGAGLADRRPARHLHVAVELRVGQGARRRVDPLPVGLDARGPQGEQPVRRRHARRVRRRWRRACRRTPS